MGMANTSRTISARIGNLGSLTFHHINISKSSLSSSISSARYISNSDLLLELPLTSLCFSNCYFVLNLPLFTKLPQPLTLDILDELSDEVGEDGTCKELLGGFLDIILKQFVHVSFHF